MFVTLCRVIVVFLLSAFCAVTAKDLGVIGPTYPIIEPDFLTTIHNLLEKKKADGDLKKLNQKRVALAKAYVDRPPGKNLPNAKKYKVVQLDPTYTLTHDIKDANGHVIYKKGLTFNPLDYHPMHETLCFINGDDKKQVKWMMKYCADPVKDKRILVEGDYAALNKKLNTRLFFDQRGYLVSYFGIDALPATVRQSGEYLMLEEYKVE